MISSFLNGFQRIFKIRLSALPHSSKTQEDINQKTKFSCPPKQLLLVIGLGVTAIVISIGGEYVSRQWQDTQNSLNNSQKAVDSIPVVTPPLPKTDDFHVAFTIANVHRSPSTNSETVTQALHGEPVKVLKEQNGWVEVKLPTQSDYSGWINKSALKKNSVASEWSNLKIVAVRYADMLKLPSKNAELLLKLPFGTVVASDSLQTDNGFTAIKLVDGNKGYVVSTELLDYPEKDVSQVSGTEILATAKQLLGERYLWGGMTSSGVDCSGFVHTVFKVHGIHLHRDTDLQYFYDGVPVARNKLEPGDLLFFETYQPGPSHVGIYVGNQKFLQASSSRGVSYDSLDSPYFSKRFLGAKRILQNSPSNQTQIPEPF